MTRKRVTLLRSDDKENIAIAQQRQSQQHQPQQGEPQEGQAQLR